MLITRPSPSCDLGWTLCFVRLKCNFSTISIVSIICHSADGATVNACHYAILFGSHFETQMSMRRHQHHRCASVHFGIYVC